MQTPTAFQQIPIEERPSRHAAGRLRFGLTLMVGLLLAVAPSPADAQGRQSDRERPNILWLIAEDMGADLGVYDQDNVRTPHLDSLAAEVSAQFKLFEIRVQSPVTRPVAPHAQPVGDVLPVGACLARVRHRLRDGDRRKDVTLKRAQLVCCGFLSHTPTFGIHPPIPFGSLESKAIRNTYTERCCTYECSMSEALRDEIATVAPYANTNEHGEYTGDVEAGE